MFRYVLLLTVLGAVAADIAEFQKCDESPDSLCAVSEVRVTPCKNGKVCRIKKGTESSIEFDFTPGFSAEKLKAGLFWAKDTGDIPFGSFYNADACGYTTCPLVAGTQQKFTYSLRLGKKLPDGVFLFKLKVWDEADNTKNCCFKTNVRLVR